MRLSHASSREIMYFYLLLRRIFRRAFPFSRRCWACFSDKAWVLVFFSNVALRSSFKTRRIVVLETPCRRASAIWVGGLSLSVAKSTFLMRSFVRLDGRHCGPSRFNDLGLPWFIESNSLITRETVILEPVIPDSIRARIFSCTKGRFGDEPRWRLSFRRSSRRHFRYFEQKKNICSFNGC